MTSLEERFIAPGVRANTIWRILTFKTWVSA
jgi:hypothetical protein